MKKTFQSVVVAVMVGLLMGGVRPVYAVQGDVLTFTGSGAKNGVEIFRVDANGQVISSSATSNGNLTIQPTSDLIFGSTTTAVSTTTTSGVSQGAVYTATLVGSPNAVEGSVLIATSCPSGTTGVCVALSLGSANQTNAIGIAAYAASTTAVVGVYDTGWVLALGTGTINPGDLLVPSASAGYLATTQIGSTGTVAIALGSNTTGSGNLLKVKLR